MKETFDITPTWGAVVATGLRVCRQKTAEPFVVASLAVEIARLGEAAYVLFLEAIDPKVNNLKRRQSEEALLVITNQADSNNEGKKR